MLQIRPGIKFAERSRVRRKVARSEQALVAPYNLRGAGTGIDRVNLDAIFAEVLIVQRVFDAETQMHHRHAGVRKLVQRQRIKLQQLGACGKITVTISDRLAADNWLAIVRRQQYGLHIVIQAYLIQPALLPGLVEVGD